jgi:hypothetical protein
MTPGWPAALGLMILVAGGVQPPPARELAITARMHHLRSGAAREWADFPADAEGRALVLRFPSAANSREWALRVRHRDVKLAWRIRVNDREIGVLPPDEADTVSYWAVPPDTIREGANELRIEGSGPGSDDVSIGGIRLIHRPRAEALAEASVDVTVRDAPGNRAVPCRITVADADGALVGLGNVSDAGHAVRPGVIYTRDGTARLQLPAGRYTIYAGRGFEYGVDRVAVDLASGAHVSRRLTIRREVDTAGWAAMDTHVHTATYARHGDATIAERMLTLAGEGIELPVSAEHNQRVDFEPIAREAGVRRYVTPVLGSEVTTPALGHFNVFPLAPSGPAIDQRAADWAAIGRSIAAAAARPLVVLNHGRDEHGGFRPFDHLEEITAPGGAAASWPLPANAMEVVNSGAVRRDPLQLPRDWMALLTRGLRLTPIGASDSHDVARYIVGQGRTYVRVDDRDPGAIDVAAAMESLRAGRVLVSDGLLTEITVDGRGPGELVPAAPELGVRIRVQGPSWTAANHVALYVNGTVVREAAIRDGGRPGVKWHATWRIPAPATDAHLVAIATGPGVTAPFWPTAKPYQPTSIEFTPYVHGVSGAVFVDTDANGRFTPPSRDSRSNPPSRD